MGEVYLAQDTKLDRKVALKILPANVADDRNRMNRFVQEARAASALNHPNIITIYEIEQADSVSFIATEFIDGETLRQRIRIALLKLGEVLDVAAQIAGALSAAHVAGIVHRDIKPENIMLRHDGIVKVLDFGLAKLSEPLAVAGGPNVDSEAQTRANIKTDPGVVMGTAVYMSPEQARGLEIDARTDIFSLGVVLYEMVAGRLPFAGSSSSEVIASILSEKEPQPLARYSREVPAELERIVSKALRKDREQRYQTTKDLMLDLLSLKQQREFEAKMEHSQPAESKVAAAIASEPSAVETITKPIGGPTSTIERLTGALKLRWKGVFLAAAAVLMVAVTAALYFYFADQQRTTINSIAVLPFANVSGDPNTEYLTDGLTESLIERLSRLPNLRVMSRSSVFRYKGKEIDAQQAARILNVEALLLGQVVQRGDDLIINVELVRTTDGSYLWGARFNRKVEDILTVQQDITREISESLRLSVTGEEQRQVARRSTENPEAYQLYLRGRYFWNRRTEEGLRKSIEYYEQAIKSDPNFALAYVGLSDSYGMTTSTASTFPPGEAALKAKEAALRALEIDDTLAEAHVALARVKMNFDWDWAAAEHEFRRAIERNPGYAEAHHLYAHYLMAMKRVAEAFAESKQYLELDPLSLAANYHLGWHYLYARQYDEALAQLRRTAELDPNFVGTLLYLGWVYEQKRMYAEAIATFQQAVQLSNTPLTLASLGHAYAIAGRRDEAQKILAQLGDLSKQRYVSAFDIAVIYVGLNEPEQALTWLERAYQEHSQFMIYIDTDPRLDSLRTNLRFQDIFRRLRFPSQGN